MVIIETFARSLSPMKPLSLHQFVAILAIASFPMTARAIVTGPYTPDATTAHLWHLDETAGASATVNAISGKNGLIAIDGNPATANPLPVNTTVLGAAGALGFGNAASISAGDLGLGYDGNGSGSYNPEVSGTNFGVDAVSTSSFMGANGAFTLEALVNLPSRTSAAAREIIGMDNSGALDGGRPFQFVITSTGTLRFREFANNVTFELAIPTTGPDAFQANTWFHAAYTYDGEGTGTLYWTLLDPSRTLASVLATNSSLLDMPASSATLVIGNENRNVFGEGLLGEIDEVRISSEARGADDFVFVPEPSSALLLAAGGLVMARRRTSRRGS